MELTRQEMANAARAKVDQTLETVRQAMRDKDLDAYNEGMSTLDEQVKAYNECLSKVEFERLAGMDAPMIEAVKQFYIELYRVKEEKDKETKSLTGVNLEIRKSRIDLLKFCEDAGISTEWSNDCEKLLALLVAQKTDVFNMDPETLARKSYYFLQVVARKRNGETPDSKTQCVKMLQQIVDGAICINDADGKNTLRVNNHDVAFIHECVGKLDTKEMCTISTINARQFRAVMMSVFAHVLGEKYVVKGSKKKAE